VSPEPVNEPESEPERTGAGAGPGSFTGINATEQGCESPGAQAAPAPPGKAHRGPTPATPQSGRVFDGS